MSITIYLVTHGQKDDNPNPGLTPVGEHQTSQLRQYLPTKPRVIVCGTGRRHLQTAEVLGLTINRYSIILGTPESKTKKGTVMLTDGTEIPYEQYTSVTDRAEAFRSIVNSLGDGTVVITSRSMIGVLDFNGDPKAAAVYIYKPNRETVEERFTASDDIGDGAQEV